MPLIFWLLGAPTGLIVVLWLCTLFKLQKQMKKAFVSIGGFLGMGTLLVVVPYDTLKFVDKKIVFPGGTKAGLKILPEFKYATEWCARSPFVA